VAARPSARPGVQDHRHARRQRRRVCGLRAVGRRRPSAGRRGGQTDPQGRAGRPAAGQAVCRLPQDTTRPPPHRVLHERVRALGVGRRRRLLTPPGAGLSHPRRAGARDAAPTDPARAVIGPGGRADRGSLLPGAGDPGRGRFPGGQATRGAAGHGDRIGQDPHRDRAGGPAHARRQLAQLNGDVALAERCRETVQGVAVALLTKTAIPSVAEQARLLDEVADDDWWVDVTVAMLDLMRRRIRGLVQFVEKTRHNPVYTDFVDALGNATEVVLPGTTPGFDPSASAPGRRPTYARTRITSPCRSCAGTGSSLPPTWMLSARCSSRRAVPAR